MELYQIRSFIAVAEALNLTHAAKATYQSPSAVSSQIKSLENEFGVVLFKRSTKGMTLTPEGEDLLISAKKLDGAAKDLSGKASRLSQTLSGTVNIGINTDPGYLNLSGLSQWMSEALPKVTLTYIETQTYSTPGILKKGTIDLGFHFGQFNELGIHSLILAKSRIRVVLPAGKTSGLANSPLAELVKFPWVWTRHACPFHSAFQERLDRENLKLKATADAVDEKIVEELVKSGTGAALMREDQALKLVDNGWAVFWDGPEDAQFNDAVMEIPLCLACLDNRKGERLITAFLSAIEKFKHIPLT